MKRASIASVGLTLFLAACGSSNSGGNTGGSGGTATGGSTGTGGTSHTGGTTGTGGTSNTGGNTGTGGVIGTGGTTGTGGAAGAKGTGGATGGTTGTGGAAGAKGTGGTTGTGGSATGGTTGTGGAAGAKGTGGTPGTGGTTSGSAVITSASGAYWTNATFTTPTSGSATVTVSTTAGQKWEGFGGAFNELGWKYLTALGATDQAAALDLLFGSDAAHFGIGRIPIGASDYAIARYTDEETQGTFTISQDMMYLIPYVKAAMAVNSNLRFWASPWTPPTWMKTFSGTANGISCAHPSGDSSNFDGGCMNATSANLTALASYFTSWVQAFGAQGIPIDTLAPQNEPGYAQGYPSCIWNPADYVTFMKGALATAFPSSGSTKIMLGTMSNGDNGATSKDLLVVQAVEADSAAKAIPKVMGLQWGMLDLYEGLGSGVSQSNFMTGSLSAWATEHKCGNYPWNPTGTNSGTGTAYGTYVEPAPNDQAYGIETWDYIRNAITKGGVTAYNAWNMILDQNGKGNDTTRQWSQDTLLIAKASSGTYSCKGNAISGSLCATPAYYVFRHCSQYVQVGATVMKATGGDAIAFKNPDGSYVAVMYNSGAAGTYTVSVGGKMFQFSMPSNGWATVYSAP